MGGFPACPAEALSAAEVQCGRVGLREITHRRGSAVWKADGPRGTVAVKTGYGDGAEAVAREAAALAALPGYSVTTGRAGADTWYITDWHDGPSTWRIFQPVRERTASGKDRSYALAGAVGLCRAVADLHSIGWVHGDLQPVHGIHTVTGVMLIDFAWSWRVGQALPPHFRGGITHLIAPELAARIDTGPQPVTPTPQADVYALAGVLWTCVTGTWPLDYGAVGITPQHVSPGELRKAIAVGRIPLTAGRPWPGPQAVLADTLTAPAADRPTADELAEALAFLTA
ncbi:serine/threonine-protein kinase [Streptomyces odonnellii]|uniref:hypothetical protein n=1 Tax=Streptomyces odonnellii TaxID=1417980 RepID=UPI000625325B|nr:hypothetical protein [Streptomyces odonnellii]